MTDAFLKKSIRYTAVLVLGICLLLAVTGRAIWAAGFLVGGLWSVADLILTFKLMQIAVLKGDKRSLYAILLLKFPVLYSIGILILISKFFPVASLLLGLLPIFIIMGIIRLCTPNFQTS